VLERVCAGLAVSAGELAGMGVGGLLDEDSIRPSPRSEPVAPRDAGPIAAIVLAAGRASRMGSNKLIAELDGAPIVRRTVAAVLGSRARPIVVVTGHEAEAVRAALAGLDVRFVHNADFADGMSTSLRVGLAAAGASIDDRGLPPGGSAAEGRRGSIDAALICLGDMPRLRPEHFDAVIDAFRAGDPAEIIVPVFDRKRGNPVLWPRRYFAEIAALSGDVGAKALIDRYADHVRQVAIDDPAILVDVDTPAALAELRRRAEPPDGG
jgi:molybdenum cofactor cytidylyltransferase